MYLEQADLIYLLCRDLKDGKISTQDVQQYVIPVRGFSDTDLRMHQLQLFEDGVIYESRFGYFSNPFAVMKRRKGVVYADGKALSDGDYRIIGIVDLTKLDGSGMMQVPMIEKIE